MSKYPSWPTSNQGNIVGGRVANEIYHRFAGLMSGLSATDQKDAALAELLATTGEEFNVKSYGAVGDGTADDTAALQSAFDAAAAVNGTVTMPEGRYVVTSTVTITGVTNGLKLVGVGPEKTIIDGGALATVTQDVGQVDCATSDHLLIQGIQFENDGLIETLTFRGCSHFVVENCRFVQPAGAATVQEAVVVTDATSTPSTNFTFRRNSFVCPSLAVRVRAGSGEAITDFRFTENYFDATNDSTSSKILGIQTNTSRWVVANNAFEGQAQNVTLFKATEGAREGMIIGNTFNNTTGQGLRLDQGGGGAPDDDVAHISIIGNHFKTCTRGVLIGDFSTETLDACLVLGNQFDTCVGAIEESTTPQQVTGLVVAFNIVKDSSLSTGAIIVLSADNVVIGNYVSGTATVPSLRLQGARTLVLGNKLLQADGSGDEIVLASGGSQSLIRFNPAAGAENAVLSGGFAIDSTGVKTVTISHGLEFTPSIGQIQVTVSEDTAVDDWNYGLLKVTAVSSTQVTAKIEVTSASGTGSATATLNFHVMTGYASLPLG